MPDGNRIAVVGGGIVGAALAYQLTRRGAEVTLLEKQRPAAGATGSSFAWINANFHTLSHAYYVLRRMSTLAWVQLQRELDGELPLRWGGSLAGLDSDAAAEGFEKLVRRQQAWGYPTRLIGPEELRALEPQLNVESIQIAAHAEEEAALEPVAATEVLLRRAAALGADILAPCEVTGLDLRNGRLAGLQTTRGPLEADVAVIAAGVDTPRLAALAGLEVPLLPAPGVLAHTEPTEPLLERIILSDAVHFKQTPDGRMVVGTDHRDAPSAETSRERGEQLIATAARLLPQLAGATLHRVSVGWRPLPRDGYPIAGFAGDARGIYLVVTHSGVTLAPLLARLAGFEILDRTKVEILEPYRPGRFSTSPALGHLG